MQGQKSHFVGFDELACVLGVSLKKLRADLDVTSGEIRLGGTVPPIPTLKIGHLRVVAAAVLDKWLAGVGAVDEEKAKAIQVVAAEVEKPAQQRRGRPRKTATARAGELA